MKKGYTVRKYNEPVKRYCQTLSLKNNPGLIAEYRRIHSRAEVDAHMTIPDEKSIEYAERLYREYGLAVGVTSGMCYAAVDRYAQDITGHTIVFIAPDGRESYGEYFH